MKVTLKEVTVFQFPRYSSEIDSLPVEEKGKMERLASEIANSFLHGSSPIVAYMIVGHADRDAQGANVEMQVSVARAESAKAWLVNRAKMIVQQQGGDASEVDSAEFSLFGYGASSLYTQATTFPERLMNRRVVIKYAAVEHEFMNVVGGFIPNLTRLSTLFALQPSTPEVLRIRCVLAKLTNPTADDTYFEWGSLSQIAGGLNGLTDQQILAVAQSIIKSLRKDIANNNLYGFPFVTDDLVIQNMKQWEANIRHTKKELVAMHGRAPIGQVHRSVSRYITKNEDNLNHILNCFKNT